MRLKIYIYIFICLSLCSCREQNDIINASEDYSIIPAPESLELQNGRFYLKEQTKIVAPEQFGFEVQSLGSMLELPKDRISYQGTLQKDQVNVALDEEIHGEESYNLVVGEDGVYLKASTPQGVFYGIQTIGQLISKDEEGQYLPYVEVKDSPQYGYRGMHLDVCRHFFSVDFIKKYIDLLAMHKMNTFHWHLTEDQGWRIEINKYPKLTEVGAWREGTIVGNYPGTSNDNQRHGGFYSQDEIKEVVAYAAQRHITIIPEIELPGHSSAAIAAYPFLSCFPNEKSIVPKNMISEGASVAQAAGNVKIVQESWGVYNDVYCAGKESTFTFVEDVLSEVIELFPSEYIHIGGDECPKANWKRCPNCQKRKRDNDIKDEHELQSYFINRVEKFVNSKGKNIIGWDEILEGGLAPNATVMSWRGNKGGIEAARSAHNVIMSPNSHCYFDHYQSEDRESEPIAIGGFLPVEKVYAFSPIPKDLETDKHQFILGGQANLWTEYIGSEKKAEYMLLPRLSALSEALWSSEKNKDWKKFKSRMKIMESRYKSLNLDYAKHIFEEN